MLAIAALLAALLTVAASATANPSIQSKRAQAQAVLAEIQQKNSTLEKAIESYNYANDRLAQIDADLTSNRHHLVIARQSLAVAQKHIAERLRALYVNGDGGGAVEIILGAQSLDDLLNRLDMVHRVGAQDAKVLKDVNQFRHEVEQRGERLKNAHAEQTRSSPSAPPRSARSNPSSQSSSGSALRSRTRSPGSRLPRSAVRRNSPQRHEPAS